VRSGGVGVGEHELGGVSYGGVGESAGAGFDEIADVVGVLLDGVELWLPCGYG
jgi:hypothetical protein